LICDAPEEVGHYLEEFCEGIYNGFTFYLREQERICAKKEMNLAPAEHAIIIEKEGIF
jgi:hypothetical protein